MLENCVEMVIGLLRLESILGILGETSCCLREMVKETDVPPLLDTFILIMLINLLVILDKSRL